MVRSLRIGHRRFVLSPGVNMIGLEPKCAVCINDASVSRGHARITVKDPRTGRTRTLNVAALAPSDYFIRNGAFYGLAGARALFGYTPTHKTVALDSASGRPSSSTRVGTRSAGFKSPSSSARFERSTTSISRRSYLTRRWANSRRTL